MNATVIPMPGMAPVRRGFRWGRFFLWLFVAGVAGFLGLAALACYSFWPGREVRTLREIATGSLAGTWERQVEFGVGRLPAWFARKAMAWVDVDPKVRTLVGAFRGGDIAVYERRKGAGADAAASRRQPGGTTGEVWDRMRTEMESRGWEVAVLVREPREVVGVFLPRDLVDDDLRACVLVLDRDDLVIVSARVNPEPLVEVALNLDPEWPGRWGGPWLGRP